MKSYEEMANDALERIHEYDADKRRKRRTAAKAAAAVCPALIVTAAGIGLWKSGVTVSRENVQGSMVTVDASDASQSLQESTISAAVTSQAAAAVTTTVKPTEAVTSAAATEEQLPEAAKPSETVSGESPYIVPEDCLGYVYVGDVLYMQMWLEEITVEYTLGEYIGTGDDLESIYTAGDYFYYSAEDKDVIIGKLWNDGTVYLAKTVLPYGEKLTYTNEPNVYY